MSPLKFGLHLLPEMFSIFKNSCIFVLSCGYVQDLDKQPATSLAISETAYFGSRSCVIRRRAHVGMRLSASRFLAETPIQSARTS